MDVIPDDEALRGLQEGEVAVLNAAVKDGVRSCREALAHWFGTSESAPVELAVRQAVSRIVRSVAMSEARPPSPATTVLVRLLLVALIEEMGRPHVVTLN